jgi:hypothetical protein
MDTLSPVAGVRLIFFFSFPRLTRPRSQLNPIAQMAYSVLSVIPQVRLMASLIEQYAYFDARNSRISINVTTRSDR